MHQGVVQADRTARIVAWLLGHDHSSPLVGTCMGFYDANNVKIILSGGGGKIGECIALELVKEDVTIVLWDVSESKFSNLC